MYRYNLLHSAVVQHIKLRRKKCHTKSDSDTAYCLLLLRSDSSTANCIWSVNFSFFQSHWWSSSFGFFCNDLLQRDQWDWKWSLADWNLNDTVHGIGCSVLIKNTWTPRSHGPLWILKRTVGISADESLLQKLTINQNSLHFVKSEWYNDLLTFICTDSLH